jgi:DNA-binding XRE family transcriptional regulator
MKDFYHSIIAQIDDHYSKAETLTDEEVKERVSARLKAYRKEYQKTIEEVAQKVGVTRMQIMRWEACKSKPSKLAQQRLKELDIL